MLRSSALLVLVLFFGFPGCENSTKTTEEPASQRLKSRDDVLTAKEILGSVLQQYTQANSYSDKAVLYLSYRLNGRSIQEPHPWSLAWNRKKQFSADWFNAQIRCDGQHFSCYIYDIASGNIDNQQLWLPITDDVPIDVLQEDKIASHFIFGTSELPLDESEARKRNPLVHPILGFFQPKLSRTWLKTPESMERLADKSLGDIDCYRIQLAERDKTYVLWINQVSGLIEQIELPLQYLHSDVLAASEISQISFLVRFHHAQINQMIPPDRLLTEKKLAAKIVGQFVEMPESLPSSLIGDKVPPLRFLDRSARPVLINERDSDLVLFWLSPVDANVRIRELAALKQQLGDVEVYAVYTDEFLENPGSKSLEFADAFKKLSNFAVPLLYDKQLKNSSLAKIKAVPCITILTRRMDLQYAQAIDEPAWQERAVAAWKRIRIGDDVALEMRTEYQRYLDQYHQQLAMSGAGHPTPSQEQQKSSAANLVWEISSLKNPGNIYAPPGSEFIYVFDGWQTIVRVDLKAPENIKSYRLDLPDGVAVNRLRSVATDDGKLQFAAYSILGQTAFVFDSEFKKLHQFPNENSELKHRGLTECQFFDSGSKLACSFIDENGLVEVDLPSGEYKTVFAEPTKTFCRFNGSYFHTHDGKFAIDGRALEEVELLNPRTCKRFGSEFGMQNPFYALVGLGQTGVWEVHAFRNTGAELWSFPIGDQFFENEIESFGACGNHENPMTFVVSKDGLLQLFGKAGLQHTTRTSSDLNGCCVVQRGHQMFLIASARSVTCWNLPTNYATSRGVPSANSRR